MSNTKPKIQSALIALEVVGHFNEISIDTRSIIKEYALNEAEPSIQNLARIAKKEGFKTSIKKLPIQKIIENYPIPVIVLKKDGSFLTIIKKDEKDTKINGVVIFDAISQEPYSLSFEEYAKIATIQTIVLKQKFFSKQIKFGFSVTKII